MGGLVACDRPKIDYEVERLLTRWYRGFVVELNQYGMGLACYKDIGVVPGCYGMVSDG